METKKTEKANLENKRNLFFQAGLIVSLGLTLMAFEHKSSKDINSYSLNNSSGVEIDEVVEITKIDNPKPEPPKQINVTLLKIVDDSKLDVIDVFVNSEVNKNDSNGTAIIDSEIVNTTEDEDSLEFKVFIGVEEDPAFPGGYIALQEYIVKSVKYPYEDRQMGIKGTVYLSFVVEKDGSVSNVKVERGISNNCDNEAVRVVKSMPKWKAGKQRGIPVRVRFNLPIKYNLQ